MYLEDLEKVFSRIETLENKDIEIHIEEEDMGILSIQLFTREDFEEGQLGYRVDEEGNSLISNSIGDWKESWFVIGYNQDLGDPIIVDLDNKGYPIMTAMPGGDWNPQVLFHKLEEFLLKIIRS